MKERRGEWKKIIDTLSAIASISHIGIRILRAHIQRLGANTFARTWFSRRISNLHLNGQILRINFVWRGRNYQIKILFFAFFDLQKFMKAFLCPNTHKKRSLCVRLVCIQFFCCTLKNIFLAVIKKLTWRSGASWASKFDGTFRGLLTARVGVGMSDCRHRLPLQNTRKKASLYTWSSLRKIIFTVQKFHCENARERQVCRVYWWSFECGTQQRWFDVEVPKTHIFHFVVW